MAFVTGCTIAVEDVFGPQVTQACLNGFDFTLLFEEIILTVVPLGLILLYAPLKIFSLRSESVKTKRSWHYWLKMTFYFLLIALHATLLGLWSLAATPKTRATLATSILALVTYMVLTYVSHLEHRRTLRPSTALCTFFASVVLDIARVRTIWYMPSYDRIAPVFLATFLVKTVVFLLEVCEKRASLTSQYANASGEDTSGIFNRSLFLWINSLLFYGCRNILSLKGLPSIARDLTASSEPGELGQKWERSSKSSSYALLWIYVWHYKWAIAAGAFPKIVWLALTYAQPFLVQRVLDFTSDPDVENTNSIAYGLIASYAIVYIGIAISYAFYEHKMDRLVIKFRGSLVQMIFDKTLQLKETDASEGTALTLIVQDVDRVAMGLRVVHETWTAFIEVGVAIWLLERFLGSASAGAALFVAIILIAGIPVANMAGNAQGYWLEAIEERLAATSKALESMRLVRMTGAVDTVTDIIMRLRESEIKASGLYRLYSTLVICFSYAPDAFTGPLAFGTFIILAEKRGTGTLDQSTAFAALTLLSLVTTPMTTLMTVVEDVKIIATSFGRIQEHLVELDQLDYRSGNASPSELDDEKTQSSTSSVTRITSVVGEKSAIKGADMDQVLVEIQDVSLYWTEENSKPVLRDLNLQMQKHDLTMVVGPVGSGKTSLLKLILGEAGKIDGHVTTSFSLAAYCSQSPWLRFGTVQENIIGNTLWNSPRYQEVISACGLDVDFKDLADGDQTKVGVKGSQLSGGQQKRISLARALYSELPVLVLDDPITGLDRRTERVVLERVFTPSGLLKRQNRSIVMATNSAHHLAFADRIIVINADGEVEHQGSLDELSQSSEYIRRLQKQPQTAASEEIPAEDKLESVLQEAGVELDEISDDQSRTTGDLRVYNYYFKTAGWITIGIYILTGAAFTFSISFPTVWLQWWTLANEQYGTQRVGYWLGVYTGLGGLALLSTFGSSWILLMIIVPKTARKFHQRLLDTTTHATTAFLTSVDTGSILNRFSQDLELIDLELPQTLENTTLLILSAISEGVLVFIGSGYVAATIPGVIFVLYLIQKFYLRTSRQLRLLDIEAKAPLYTHLIEAMNGLASVRAYGLSDHYRGKNRNILNESQKPYYLLFSVQRWLTLVLNLLIAGLSIVLVGIVTTVRSSKTLYLGTALFNVVSFGSTLESLITDWTELEQSIGAVSRIKSYVATTNKEDRDEESGDVPSDWPSEGGIEFKDMSASYESSEKPVLSGLDLKIQGGHKVAICGRTGSGKSSLVSTLLRQVELTSGHIMVDGVDLAGIPRQEIRSRINSIPQETFFLKGTVRLNLDTQELVESDDILNEALEAVGLLGVFKDHGGLDADMDENMLSHGQRQLFCLARAMCKAGQIVILDEPTSSVDADTEAVMQKLIRERFEGRTIIAIVHKLHSILDFDRVILLDRGHVAEYGNPRELLETPTSAFKALFDTFSHASDGEESDKEK